MSQKVNKSYVSEIDQFLAKKRAELPESDSQKRERQKHERLAKRRDSADSTDDDSILWEEF